MDHRRFLGQRVHRRPGSYRLSHHTERLSDDESRCARRLRKRVRGEDRGNDQRSLFGYGDHAVCIACVIHGPTRKPAKRPTVLRWNSMKHSNDLAKIVVTAAFLAALLSSLAPRSDGQTIRGASATPPQADKQQLLTTYGKVPLSFEANAGQTSNEVKFLSRGGGYTLFLTRHAEAVLVFQKPAIQQGKTERVVAESTPAAVLRMKLAGATVIQKLQGWKSLLDV